MSEQLRTNLDGIIPQKIREESTHCLVCGRILTDPESVRRGVGPVCYFKKYGKSIPKRRKRKKIDDEVSGEDLAKWFEGGIEKY